MKKRNLVVANWKMNPETLDEAKQIFNTARTAAKGLKNSEIVICPPAPFIQTLSKLKYPKNISLGAQNVSAELKGAYTGEVSASQMSGVGAKFVLVGHSERRAMGETGELIRKKLETSFNQGLTPIFCIGEKERDKEGSHLAIIKNQIKEALTGLQKKHLVGITIAYEPVWAIGKSYKEAMTPTDIHETTLVIKKVMTQLFGQDIAASCRILYGAAVEAQNAADTLKYGNVSGFLVGHASLKPEFAQILKSADAVK